MSRLHNYKPLILLFFFSFCFFAGGQIARLFPPASVKTDDKSPSGNAASSGTVPTASTSGNPLSTILPAAENWGLSFQEEGKVPVGNASFDELQQYHAYYAQKTDKKVIYLTFDCGYENGNTPAILNALKRHNVQATFFVVGNFLRDNPELVKQMLKEGHTVGNHTFHHPDMSQIATKETFFRELKSVEALYKDITGKSMTRFYRPPQGKYSTENLQMAKDMGYHTFFWSLAYVDWLADAQPSKEEAFDKLLGRIQPVCFHQFLSDFCKPVHSIHPILIEINHIHFECIIHLRMTSSLFRMITQKICCRIKQIVIITTCSEQIIIIIF